MASALTSMQVDVAAAPPGQHYAPHDLMPLTPRQGDAMDEHDEHDDDRFDESPQTPTRHSFCGLPGQRPLPDQPLKAPTGLAAVVRSALHDIDDDVDMGEADGDTVVDDDLSDNDSITSESQRPNKKKKGQRFFCTEFPPCQLSFTRSEHLARHIRKHTGERPFQCHCSRRFSRLDNLRQHAQTVHVNEEIPGDSLAATSTRFQRQVRTDRVRPTGSRPRTNTVGSQNGTPTRGHHARNLSTSSIASTTSNASMADDAARRWQQPLAIAADSQRPSMFDEYSHSSQTHRSMMGLNTPTSQAYPNYVSGYASPSSTISRSSYYGEPRHNRRQSVPTSPNPYQSNPYAAGQFTPTSMRGSVYSGAPSGFASPTSSIFSQGRVEGESEVEYRRRTWHPNTQSNYAHRPATSGLSYHQTPDEEKPNLSQQPAASQLTRLPGIESFDYVPPVPIRQPTSPAMAEQHRPLDQALHQGLHRLDLTSSNVQQEQHWPRPEFRPEHFGRPPPLLRSTEPVHPVHYMSMPEPPTTPMRSKRQAWYGGPIAAAQAPVLQPALGSLARTSPEDSGSSDGIATPAYPQEHHPVILNQAEPQPSMHMLVDEKPNVYGQSGAHVLTSPDRQHKPILPARSDSGFQNANQANRFPIAVHTEPYSFRLQSGYDPRLASVTPHQSPTSARGPEDMGRLEALVAAATSERPVDELRR